MLAPEKRPFSASYWLETTLTFPTESSVGVMTEAPPQTAETVEMPSMVMPLVSNWPPLELTWGPFSVAKMPEPPELVPDCVPGRVAAPPAEREPSPKTPGASWASWKTSRPEEGRC